MGDSKSGGSGRSGRRMGGAGYAPARLSLETASDTFEKIYDELPRSGSGYVNPKDVMDLIYDVQGFNQKPELISMAQFEQYGDQGELQLFRGIGPGPSGDRQYADDFIQGEKHFPGEGIFGNGTYTAAGRNSDGGWDNERAYMEAEDYAGPRGTVVQMTLRRGSRVATYEQIQREQRQYQERLIGQRKIPKPHLDDPGAFAAASGYDALVVHGGRYVVVLNRGALRIVKP